MYNSRAFFKNLNTAQTASGLGIEILKDDLETMSEELAGATPPVAAPTARLRVLSTVGAPYGSVPPTAAAQSIVTYEVATSDGKTEKFRAVVPTASVPTEGYATGRILVSSAATRLKINAKASVAATVQFQALDAVTIPDDTVLQDRNTSKKYKTFGATVGGPGFVTALVEEVDIGDFSECTHGSVFTWVTPPDNVSTEATVLSMAAGTISVGRTLTDTATGKTYTTTSTDIVGLLDDAISGDDLIEIDVVGGVIGPDLVEVDTVLEFDSPDLKVAVEATVSYSQSITIPAGSLLTITSAGVEYTYATTEEGIIGDSGQTYINFAAVETGSASNRLEGDVLTFSTPVSGVTAATVVSLPADAEVYPIDLGAVVVGDALDLFSHVQKVPGGRFRADIYNAPRGS